MSTRQRATLETTADPRAEGPLLLAHAGGEAAPHPGGAPERTGDTAPPEDIAARRLRELAVRLSGAAPPSASTGADTSLDETDAEFEPVSVAAIRALGRQGPDTPLDSLADPTEPAGSANTLVALTSSPAVPALKAGHADTPPDVLALAALAPSEPLRLAAGSPPALDASSEPAKKQPPAGAPLSPATESNTLVAPLVGDRPLMLADQSASEIRLVDLIRRQQSLLDQLNRFPPAHEMLDGAAGAHPAPADSPPRSVIEQLAPPALAVLSPREAEREIPPPLPPPEKAARPSPTLSPPPIAHERGDAAAEPELPETSPIIIRRAHAERSGRYIGRAVAAPPSAVPAFFVGLAVALVIAGVLFVVL